MAIITFAQVKGGTGKTTAVMALAAELLMDGKRVAVIDADPNGHAARIADMMVKRLNGQGGALAIVRETDENRFLTTVAAARKDVDFVLVDLPGVSSKLTLLGIGRADAVIVPVQPGAMDMKDALTTIQAVDQAAALTERTIRTAFLLSRWPVSIETRGAKEVRRRIAKQATGRTILGTPLMARAALSDMSFNGAPPRLVDPQSNAAANIAAVAADILALLKGA